MSGPYAGRVGRVAGSDTSKAAGNSIEGVAESIRGRVYSRILDCGLAGSTDDELEVTLGLRHQTASARRRELVLMDVVFDSGARRQTRAGRNAIVWLASETLYQ